jgi:hypothetical protein
MLMHHIKPGIYQHSSSGKMYHVIGLCRHSETLEVLVTYQALYNDYALWVRPYEMFIENITINGEEAPRFRFLHAAFETPAQLR